MACVGRTSRLLRAAGGRESPEMAPENAGDVCSRLNAPEKDPRVESARRRRRGRVGDDLAVLTPPPAIL